MKDEIMGAENFTMATADSKWDSRGLRIATAPSAPRGIIINHML